MAYITKKEFEKNFKVWYKDFITECRTMPTDLPALWQTWNDSVDMEKRNGTVNPNSRWDQPKFVSDPKILGISKRKR